MPPQSKRKEISREEVAAEVLSLWDEESQSLRGALRRLTQEWHITDWRIRTAIHSLVFETVRRLNTIDYLLDQVLEKGQIIDIDPFTRNVLRVATYLIFFTDTAPALATNEAVSIIKRRKNKRLAGFVNAVLRNLQKIDFNEIMASFHDLGAQELEYSMPQWLFEYVTRILGPDEAKKFFSTSLQNPSVYVRVNTLIQPRNQTVKGLEQAEFLCFPIEKLPEMMKIQRGNLPVTQTDVYLQHAVYLQSLASALVSHIVNPNPAEIVLDLCAAPGSKTSHLAQLMDNRGNILALDNMLLRIEEMTRNLKRLGVQNTHVIFTNSLKLPFRTDFLIKYVLVDPPCSNTGVIQTRPEVKWAMSPNKIRRLSRVQSHLLEAGSKFVEPGGVLVYSTCSLTLDENEHLIRDFLDANPHFNLVPSQPLLGTAGFEGMTACQRLFPHRDDTEGFFIAKLRREPTSSDR
ncbi:MAG: transcription antitermination factor NusB [Promethearchaeota archaeon]